MYTEVLVQDENHWQIPWRMHITMSVYKNVCSIGIAEVWHMCVLWDKSLFYIAHEWEERRKHFKRTLRSFGHQDTLHYFFSLLTLWKHHANSADYTVFTFVYLQTKSVHTRKLESNAKGKLVRFCFDCAKWSHYFIYRGVSWRPGQTFIMFQRKKNKRFGKNGNIKNLVQKTKMGPEKA